MINELRVNILLNINIQEFENMTIFISKRRLLIDNCVEFFVFIDVVNIDKRVDRLIRIKKIIFLSFHFVTNVFIQIRENFCLSIDKNYIFHSKINLELKSKNDVYFYIVDINISMIQIRNVIDETYIVSRYTKLSRVLNYEKKNYYMTTSKNAHLTIKFKKQMFKNSFKLALTKFVDVFMFVFELILNMTFTTIIFNKIVEMFEINFTISVFTSKTKSMINRISSINEIITTREIIIYDNEKTRANLKTIID